MIEDGEEGPVEEDVDPDDDGYGDMYDDLYLGGDIGEEDRPEFLDDNDPDRPEVKKYVFGKARTTPDTQA